MHTHRVQRANSRLFIVQASRQVESRVSIVTCSRRIASFRAHVSATYNVKGRRVLGARRLRRPSKRNRLLRNVTLVVVRASLRNGRQLPSWPTTSRISFVSYNYQVRGVQGLAVKGGRDFFSLINGKPRTTTWSGDNFQVADGAEQRMAGHFPVGDVIVYVRVRSGWLFGIAGR